MGEVPEEAEARRISPAHSFADWLREPTFDKNVEVFEARVLGWQLDIAKALQAHPHAGFAILAIVMSYFEMIARHYDGDRGTGNRYRFFRKGVELVFPTLRTQYPRWFDAIAKALYSEVRGSLYHEGITGHVVRLSGDYESPIQGRVNPATKRIDRVEVNPHRLVDSVIDHFQGYVAALRDPANSQLREKFTTRFGE